MRKERIQQLVEKYGTPLQVYDEDQLVQKMRSFTSCFQTNDFHTGVIYASKAFSCKAILQLASQEGLYLDVVSGGELYTAKQAGFPMEKIFFHGNNKTLPELLMAKEYGVGHIVCDNEMEASVIIDLWKDATTDLHVLLRVNPGIEAHTHEYIVTAHVDSKFGISFQQEETIFEVIDQFTQSEHIQFDGFHAHIGSQIFDGRAYEELIKKMFAFAKKVEETKQIPIKTINLGGGFAAYYTEEDAPIPVDVVSKTIIDACTKENKTLPTPIENLYIEPGRSIVAEAGSMVYTIGYQKKTPNKSYIFVDGGMSDNIRPALYQAKYDAYILEKEDKPSDTTYTIAGKCCESGDILIEKIDLPTPETGDHLVMKTTGAYGYSMASHYNKLPLPAVVFAKEDSDRLVIRRETYEEMIALEEETC